MSLSSTQTEQFKTRRLPSTQAWRHLIMAILCILVFYPYIALLLLSLKDNDQFIHAPWVPTLPVHLENYLTAWTVIQPYVVNSILVSGLSCAGVVMLSAFSAYVFARFAFPGKEVLFYLILGLMMVPGVLSLIPQFLLMQRLRLLDTRSALILPYIAGGQVFGIFLLRSFFASIPEELFEAARVDGANHWQAFWRVGVPLCKPVLATLAIINILGTWNDLIWPYVATSNPSLRTLTVGLMFFRGEYYTNWGPLFAGYVLASIPLFGLFAVASGTFLEGLTSGALKM